MHLLVVEDDDAIAEPMIEGLIHHGFTVTRVRLGGDALGALPADLVLLDLGLPDVDGLEVCRGLRAVDPTLPIIIVSARSDEVDRIVGLEVGADDYLGKPFGIRELVARVRAVLRRTQHERVGGEVVGVVQGSISGRATGTASDAVTDNSAYVVGSLIVDLRTHRVQLDGEELALTTKEFGVLAMLAADPGAVVTRSELIERVWDEHWYGPTKTLDVHIAQLRRKLGDPRWIETVRSVGYRLAHPL